MMRDPDTTFGWLKWSGFVCQMVGLGLTAFGIGVVRGWVRSLVRSLHRWWVNCVRWTAMQRERLHIWWQRVRHKHIIVKVGAATAHATAGGVTFAKGRKGIDRENSSDSQVLAYVYEQVETLLTRHEQQEEQRLADRQELDRRLAGLRDEMRSRIAESTKQGWELIVGGLAFSAIGTILGAMA